MGPFFTAASNIVWLARNHTDLSVGMMTGASGQWSVCLEDLLEHAQEHFWSAIGMHQNELRFWFAMAVEKGYAESLRAVIFDVAA